MGVGVVVVVGVGVGVGVRLGLGVWLGLGERSPPCPKQHLKGFVKVFIGPVRTRC